MSPDSNQYFKMLNDLKESKKRMKEDIQGNPEELLRNMGVDISRIDKESLQKSLGELVDSASKFGALIPNID